MTRPLLERVEKELAWLDENGDTEGACPWCYRWRGNQDDWDKSEHKPDCALAQLLADVREELAEPKETAYVGNTEDLIAAAKRMTEETAPSPWSSIRGEPYNAAVVMCSCGQVFEVARTGAPMQINNKCPTCGQLWAIQFDKPALPPPRLEEP